MSDTMSASGVQVLEPRPRLSGQAPDASSPSGTYDMQNQDGVLWDSVTIEQNANADGWTLSATLPEEGGTPFSGSAGLVLAPFQHVQFTSDTNPETEFVYISLIDNMITLTYIKYPEDHTIEPTATGVWLGTSSGGQRHPQVKA